jgi:ferritin-like metal-binding protein YciE
MGRFSKDIETMDDLFVHQLKDIYYAEKRVVGALPEMIEKATGSWIEIGLRFSSGRDEESRQTCGASVPGHGAKPETVTCPAIDGIIKEADEVAGEVDDKNVLDAALIAAAQAVEHYEMTRYGTLIAWAKVLGRNDCTQVLQQNLAEEKAADNKLTAIAESSANQAAA